MTARMFALLAVLLISACGDRTPSSPSPSASSSLNGTWRIFSTQLVSEGFQVIHAPELTYQVTFDDARVSARIDCNTCNGSFTIAGTSLMVGSALACTRAACTHQASDNHIMTLLPGPHELSESVYASRDGVLRPQVTLRSSRGTMILRQQ